jgi:hypothetical protein
MSTAFVKVALLLQYLRVYQDDQRMRWLCIGVMIFTSLWGFAYSFMAWFPCFPVSGYWNWTRSGAKCYGYGSLQKDAFYGTYFSSSLLNTFLDVVILLIPIPLYFRKDTLHRTKMGLLALLIMGGL